jgi:membrane protein required for colicin V production
MAAGDFLAVFVLVVVLVQIGAKLVEKTVDLALLGWLNRMAGAVLYVFLYAILLSILMFYAERVHIVDSDTLQASVTWPWIERLGPWAIDGLGWLVPFFKDMFSDLETFFEGVNGRMT